MDNTCDHVQVDTSAPADATETAIIAPVPPAEPVVGRLIAGTDVPDSWRGVAELPSPS